MVPGASRLKPADRGWIEAARGRRAAVSVEGRATVTCHARGLGDKSLLGHRVAKADRRAGRIGEVRLRAFQAVVGERRIEMSLGEQREKRRRFGAIGIMGLGLDSRERRDIGVDRAEAILAAENVASPWVVLVFECRPGPVRDPVRDDVKRDEGVLLPAGLIHMIRGCSFGRRSGKAVELLEPADLDPVRLHLDGIDREGDRLRRGEGGLSTPTP